MEKVLKYIEENEKRYVDEMVEWLKIESVSADPKRAGEVKRAGEWCAKRLEEIGFENVALKETTGHPAVYGEWLHAGPDKPTIMCYGHYDVQPEDPVEKWTSPPFEPTIRDGKIYARGTADDKGQLLTHLFALEAIMKQNGKLPVNVKVFVEGEEEGGTGGTHAFVEQNRDLLACDAVAISDSSWYVEHTPTISYALRGICYLEVRVKGPSRDLHSGMYGGKVQNPLNAMARIIAKLHDDDGRIQVPGFYDDVLELTDTERKEFRAVGDEDEDLKKDLGVPRLWGEKGFTSAERNWARPSLDVHGVWGGYAGEGGKTVIATDGGFKISARLVANQDPEKCLAQIKKYIEEICPPGVTVEVTPMHCGSPVMVKPDSPYIKAALAAFESGFGKRAILVREGASIPITATFMSALEASPVLIGFGLAGDNIHSPDENFRLDHFQKGVVTNAYLYEEFAKIRKAP